MQKENPTENDIDTNWTAVDERYVNALKGVVFWPFNMHSVSENPKEIKDVDELHHALFVRQNAVFSAVYQPIAFIATAIIFFYLIKTGLDFHVRKLVLFWLGLLSCAPLAWVFIRLLRGRSAAKHKIDIGKKLSFFSLPKL